MEPRELTSKVRSLTIFLTTFKTCLSNKNRNNRKDQNDRKISWGKNLTLAKESRPSLQEVIQYIHNQLIIKIGMT